ncbi:hypothetical protein GPECTOR_10g901 [Gonium pectorale]|uniref:DNA recombination and repair protein Rad51-like C-terminal domain-containing protein n=1 Tax=Gonium pectorale TaxID=33097 RepID=A0A150GSH3_GONPE|nr:hypothetical protein GPECTOR_10g901 [Gonium pectorale]|eukprot:KXZ52270.1 hypothetical protein GPECTOR_10g901 [Gonium pectorale]
MDATLPPDLAAILAFNETGAQFFKRVHQERVLTGLPIIDQHVSFRPGVVIEVAGPPGSGKTELLLSVALHVLLTPYADPKAWLARAAASGAPGGGMTPAADREHQAGPAPRPPPGSGNVVILDLDGKFDGVVEEVLSRLHLLRCRSSMQLLAALVAMPSQLEAWRAEDVPCRLLLIDNVAIASRLAHVCRLFRLPVLATKAAAVTAKGQQDGEGLDRPGGGWPGSGGGGGGEGCVQLQQREYMPMPWQNIVTHRMLLYPRGVIAAPSAPPGFAPAQTLTAVLAEMLGPVGQGAAAAAAGSAGGGVAGSPEGGSCRAMSQLLISAVAMVEEW